MSFIEDKKQETRCTTIKINLLGNHRYIEPNEINKLITRNQGSLRGKLLNTLNLQEIENILKNNPFIEYTQVYEDMDGTIRIQIQQRDPLIRVINLFNQDFYIDHKGHKMPTSAVYTAHVLVANGFIMESFSNKVDTLKSKLARDLLTTALFIEKDPLWSQQIEQIYINANSEFELVPRVGNHKIILGNTDSLENKFRNLLAFYKRALPKVGWNSYKTINLKYTNQIVCEKMDEDSLTVKTNSDLQKLSISSKVISHDTVKNLKQ